MMRRVVSQLDELSRVKLNYLFDMIWRNVIWSHDPQNQMNTLLTSEHIAEDIKQVPVGDSKYNWKTQMRFYTHGHGVRNDGTNFGADTGTKTYSDKAFGLSDDEDRD